MSAIKNRWASCISNGKSQNAMNVIVLFRCNVHLNMGTDTDTDTDTGTNQCMRHFGGIILAGETKAYVTSYFGKLPV